MVVDALADEDAVVLLRDELGAGIRTIGPMFALFEKVVNAVHVGAPHAKLAFNTTPTDTAESVQR